LLEAVGPETTQGAKSPRLAGVLGLKIHVRLFIVAAVLIIKMFIKHLAALKAKIKTTLIYSGRLFGGKPFPLPPALALPGRTAAGIKINPAAGRLITKEFSRPVGRGIPPRRLSGRENILTAPNISETHVWRSGLGPGTLFRDELIKKVPVGRDLG